MSKQNLDSLDNQQYDEGTKREKRTADNRLAVGPIHMGAAAFAILTTSLIAAYLKWLAHTDVPAEVLVPTETWVAAVVGYLYPNAE